MLLMGQMCLTNNWYILCFQICRNINLAGMDSMLCWLHSILHHMDKDLVLLQWLSQMYILFLVMIGESWCWC